MPLGLKVLGLFILGLFALYLVMRIAAAAVMKSIEEAKKKDSWHFRRYRFNRSNKEHK